MKCVGNHEHMKPDDDDFVLHRQLLLQLGDRLRRLRKDAKVRVELAKRAGVSRTTLYAVEAGDPSPSMGNYLRPWRHWVWPLTWRLWRATFCARPRPDSAAGRSHRPKPQVSIIVSADNKRHQAQDLQSLVLHELAVDLVKNIPERIKEAQQVLERWMATAGPQLQATVRQVDGDSAQQAVVQGAGRNRECRACASLPP